MIRDVIMTSGLLWIVIIKSKFAKVSVSEIETELKKLSLNKMGNIHTCGPNEAIVVSGKL